MTVMAENDWAAQPLPTTHNTGDTSFIAPEWNLLRATVAALRGAISKPTTHGNQLLASASPAATRALIGAGTSNLTAAQAVAAVGGKLWTGTAAQYAALTTKDVGTVYVVTP